MARLPSEMVCGEGRSVLFLRKVVCYHRMAVRNNVNHMVLCVNAVVFPRIWIPSTIGKLNNIHYFTEAIQ